MPRFSSSLACLQDGVWEGMRLHRGTLMFAQVRGGWEGLGNGAAALAQVLLRTAAAARPRPRSDAATHTHRSTWTGFSKEPSHWTWI